MYDVARIPDRPPDSLPLDLEMLPPLAPKWSAPAFDAPISKLWKKLEDVPVRCGSSACDEGLHCFRLSKRVASTLGPGACKACGRSLISMSRVARRNLEDVNHTFAALQQEFIRHYFWHVPFGDKATNYATRLGRNKLETRIPQQLRTRIGRANNPYDGRQTPIDPSRTNAIDIAMHAVAACCRACVKYWHGIPTDRALNDDEIAYLGELIRLFLQARMPNLDARSASEIRRDGNQIRRVDFGADAEPAHPSSTRIAS
jgi:hypothetical protein